MMGDVVRPNVSYTDRSFELRGWNLVGGYALSRIGLRTQYRPLSRINTCAGSS